MASKGKNFIHIVAVGDTNTGKSSLLSFLKNGSPTTTEVPSTFETFSYKMKVEGHKVDLGLWDTSGAPEYDALRRLSYPTCDVFILCYSINSRRSFENAGRKWLPEIRKYCPTTPVVLVATKQDLRPRPSFKRSGSTEERSGTAVILPKNGTKPTPVERFVKMDEGMQLAQELDACVFLECSAKSNDGVMEVFENAAKAYLQAQGKIKKKTKGIGGLLGVFKK